MTKLEKMECILGSLALQYDEGHSMITLLCEIIDEERQEKGLPKKKYFMTRIDNPDGSVTFTS